MKTDIRRLGISPSGIPIYAFRYVWGGPLFVGTMAQDLLSIRPHAVILTSSGYYQVDYDKLDIQMISLDDEADLATEVNIVAAIARATRPAEVGSAIAISEPRYQPAL